jgi:hypothetical protein
MTTVLGNERTQMTSRKRPSRPRAADIELVASVEANELRFDHPPQTEVRFFGEPQHESASGSDRTNLPEQVDPDVTYRNVRIEYLLATRLAEPTNGAGKQARAARPNERRP